MSSKPQSIHDMANYVFSEAVKRANAEKYDEAAGVYSNLTDLYPALSHAFHQRGRCHWEMNRIDDARKDFERACQMEPDNDDFAWTLGLVDLQQNNYERGWKGYARRWKSSSFKSARLDTTLPEWKQGCGAKKVLVWPEQGLGDQIIYSSILPWLAEYVKVTAVVDMRLTNLFKRGMPEVNFIPQGVEISLDEFDAHIPIGSLGQHFIDSTKDIDFTEASYIQSDLNRVKQLKQKYNLGEKVIGLSWASTAPTVGKQKSCTLKDLEPILEWGKKHDVQFMSLQYGYLPELDEYPQIIKPDERLFFDLESAAALMTACDRIVSVSNVNVHLAGAMGVDVNMLDANKLWYWNAKDSDGYSLWYPTVKIHPREHMLAPWTNQVRSVLKYLEEQY